jgi:RNA polymerase sigma-70 factor (ECF subfamily)
MVSSPRSQGGRPRLWLASKNGASRTPEQPKPSALEDKALLDALRRCEPSAAPALHDRARPIVDRTVARLLGRSDMDREDIAQLALIELVTTIERFRGDCSLDSWIAMITARVVYKHIRRRKLERKIFGATPAEEPIRVAHQPHTSEAMLRSVIARVRSHLDALDPRKAWTFLLHDVCGYDLQEIAQITSTSITAAQTRLTRGRRELHERMAADPELNDWLEETGGVT